MQQPPFVHPDRSIKIRPFWKIVSTLEKTAGKEISIVVKPGAGWGTGTHETTQLCLQALGLMSPARDSNWRMLDFGSGSGILSIAGAKLGATVTAIEIEDEAMANGRENAELNAVSSQVRYFSKLVAPSNFFELVVANILRSVLLEFADDLTQRLVPGGTLLLSGLVSTDLPEVTVRYASFLKGQQPEIYQRGDWRALIWRTVKI